MLFNTPQFFVFLAVVLILFYTAPRVLAEIHSSRRQLFLLHELHSEVHSAAAFAHRHRLHGGALDRQRRARRGSRKTALVISLTANLGLLGFFKYYNFFAANIAHLLHRPENAFALSIILPLGISFHTFQSMSYVIDVYRRNRNRSPIPSITRCSFRSSRSWWRDPLSARANSSATFTIGSGRLRMTCCAGCCCSFLAWPRKW